ncbi:hypothetical protein NQ317_002564 [Molorchus minor]|uniref:Uncharacterized protein n=1 Tax=Molorchus minor TaxID=1323400 RepID=A0ABQ9IS13_9CUCU|nr:hypothetical protein NQ317_002564 [Molorchus minor]
MPGLRGAKGAGAPGPAVQWGPAGALLLQNVRWTLGPMLDIRRTNSATFRPSLQPLHTKCRGFKQRSKITAVVSELRGDLCIVNSALKKISARDSTLDVNRIATLLQTGLLVHNDETDDGKDNEQK